ncbi:MAG TPA: bifunctional oligoribonuclease/PAP phosphatase NrnA [Candidatus Bathyarchaeia archaeon]|nr:bifunctional oligoribonuclease/PAP phosphatase NrnA [Candidatus Bathyarchaeia archaeon]
MNYKFAKEFNEIKKELEKSRRVLLVAHSRPDGDTIGSVFALKGYLENDLGKKADAVCSDPYPEYLKSLFGGDDIVSSEKISADDYDLLIGSDAVGRSFEKIVKRKNKGQKVIIFDHHPTIELKEIKPDIMVADENYSSVCEILYDFFDFHRIDLDKKMAAYLLTGILNDTAVFQHANTSARVMEISAALMRKGAPMSKIIEATFKNKKLETLKLWGRALQRAEINEKTGAILSFITTEDMRELGIKEDEVGRIAELLNTVVGTKFSLVLIEKGQNKIKGSLRSEWYKNVDVSEIAQKLRGGGHKLASGFEIVGKIVKNGDKITVE